MDPKDQQAVGKALGDGWVITYPQGTTRPFAPVRKGSAHIIKQFRPTVVPVVLSGFGEAFAREGLTSRRKGVELSFRIKPPLQRGYDAPTEDICALLADAIEQSKRFATR